MNKLTQLILQVGQVEKSNPTLLQKDFLNTARKEIWQSINQAITLKILPVNDLLTMAVHLENTSEQMTSWKKLRNFFPHNFFEEIQSLDLLYLDLTFNCIFQNKQKAFEVFIEKFIKTSVLLYNKGTNPDVQSGYELLYRLGFFQGEYSVSINSSKTAEILMENKQWYYELTNLLISFLGKRQNNEKILDKLFEVIILTANNLTRTFNDKSIFYLSSVDAWMLHTLAKKNESRDRVNKILEKSSFVLEQITANISNYLNKYSHFNQINLPNTFADKNNNKIVVAFLIHSGTYLAHTKNLVTFFKGLIKINSIIEPILIVKDSTILFQEEFNKLNIKIIFIQPKNFYFKAIDFFAKTKVDLLIFISVPVDLHFFSLFNKKLFKLVWWSMKWDYPILSKEIWRMKSGKLELEKYNLIDNVSWRSCSTSLVDLQANESLEEINNLEFKIKGHKNFLIIGVLGRSAKITPEYLSTIKSILDLFTDTLFVYTCEPDLENEINNLINIYGDPLKMISLGWLKNTKIATNIIDVYLDSFPFASGHTAFEMIALGKPVLVLTTKESINSSCATAYLDYINRNNLKKSDYGIVSSKEEYISLACKLIKEISFRHHVGSLLKELLLSINPSIQESAKQIEQHLLEIYYEKSPN